MHESVSKLTNFSIAAAYSFSALAKSVLYFSSLGFSGLGFGIFSTASEAVLPLVFAGEFVTSAMLKMLMCNSNQSHKRHNIELVRLSRVYVCTRGDDDDGRVSQSEFD